MHRRTPPRDGLPGRIARHPGTDCPTDGLLGTDCSPMHRRTPPRDGLLPNAPPRDGLLPNATADAARDGPRARRCYWGHGAATRCSGTRCSRQGAALAEALPMHRRTPPRDACRVQQPLSLLCSRKPYEAATPAARSKGMSHVPSVRPHAEYHHARESKSGTIPVTERTQPRDMRKSSEPQVSAVQKLPKRT